MLETTVQKLGDGLGILLPQEILNRLHTAEGGRLFLVEESDGTYRLTSADAADETVLMAAEDVIRRYDSTLRALRT